MALAQATYGAHEGTVELEVKDGKASGELPVEDAGDLAQGVAAVEDYAHLNVKRDGKSVSIDDVQGAPDGAHVVVWYRVLTEGEKQLNAQREELAKRSEAGDAPADPDGRIERANQASGA